MLLVILFEEKFIRFLIRATGISTSYNSSFGTHITIFDERWINKELANIREGNMNSSKEFNTAIHYNYKKYSAKFIYYI